MPTFISNPETYVLTSLVVALLWVVQLVIKGDLATKRVIEAKDAELNALKETNREDRQQLTVLLTETVPTMNSLLVALRSSVPDREGTP